MIIDSAVAAASRLLSPEFRAVFWKTAGLTILILIGLWFMITGLFDAFALPAMRDLMPDFPAWLEWLGLAMGIMAGLGLALGLGLLIAPVTALIGGLFVDDIAEIVEREDYPADPRGQALATFPALVISLKFVGLVIVGNVLALFLLLVPGINLIAFFVVNGYLIGREYFEFAAMRFRSEAEAKALRRDNAGVVFMGGLVIAGFLAIPLVNLLTPLFAAAFMVHLHKRVSARGRVNAS